MQIQKQVSFVDDVYKLHNLPTFYKVCLVVYWALLSVHISAVLQEIACVEMGGNPLCCMQ